MATKVEHGYKVVNVKVNEYLWRKLGVFGAQYGLAKYEVLEQAIRLFLAQKGGDDIGELS